MSTTSVPQVPVSHTQEDLADEEALKEMARLCDSLSQGLARLGFQPASEECRQAATGVRHIHAQLQSDK